jgi:hypothetical protein
MPAVNYKTTRLSQGKHSSPAEGVCVMELASMIAGEPFSDRPASVCPVIGSFLRAYNDSVSRAHRQDLYVYAAKVVGSRADAQVEKARAECLAAWRPDRRHGRLRRLLPLAVIRAACGPWQPPIDYLGAYAVQSITSHTERTHADALALVDRLLAITSSDRHDPPASATNPTGGGSKSATSTGRPAPRADAQRPRAVYFQGAAARRR